MPTVKRIQIRRVGNPDKRKDLSGILTLPIDYVRYLEKVTGKSAPEVEIWGDSILIIKPVSLNFDSSVKSGVIKLLNEIQETEKQLDVSKND